MLSRIVVVRSAITRQTRVISRTNLRPISRYLSSSRANHEETPAETTSSTGSKESLQQKLTRIDREIKKVEEHSRYSVKDASLIDRPDLWKGLPDDVIIKLYRQRVINMGKSYRRSKVELEALLSTASNPAEAAFIQSVYYDTESKQFDADTEIDYDNYITEGEYMDDLDESNEYDEYPTIAQDIVRDFRDQLEFNRKAAYELPALAKYRQEYKPVSKEVKPVTYKYTTFLGEQNPGERKVVLQLNVSDLKLSDEVSHKLKLLAGSRYDYTTDIFKMSSDKFLEPAQNASYLSDILNDLITESKRDPQEYADVPLDTRAVDARLGKRQHRNKKVYKFPEEWERKIEKGDRKMNLQEVVELTN
ncbi:DEKNAAC102759 [Brettanomyces naardenensis]|uniref:DEKNAAC102759 n=1 Tax=Brettanomyces naardenensis TaxID=13370 RepID=A0A448YLC5_BRENA|nr:DEKNAAC102759 [Brettanomyces naardenensis]